MTTISAPRVLTGSADLQPGWVRFEDGLVVAVGAGAPPRAEPGPDDAGPDDVGPDDVELDEGVLVPGLVDAQVNGGFGVDLSATRGDEDGPDGESSAAGEGERWLRLARALPATGVTAFAPTLVTAAVPDLAAALRRFAGRRPELDATPGAARTLGLHLEGPFLSPIRRGAHRGDLLVDPTPEAVEALLEAGAGGALLYLTLAPELPGGLDAVARLAAAGVRVAVGHSDATQQVVHAAADAGATLVTHLFNAQRPLHHRDPGVVGAALVDDRLTCGLILDGHHVAPAAARIAFCCTPDRLMLVSDAVAALGMPPGTYRLGGDDVLVAEGEPPRRLDGTIAGAAGRLDDAIGRAVAAGLPLRTAVEAASRVPAAALGRPDLGRIAPGGPADLVWLAPDDMSPDGMAPDGMAPDGMAPDGGGLRTRATWVAGVLAFGQPPLRP